MNAVKVSLRYFSTLEWWLTWWISSVLPLLPPVCRTLILCSLWSLCRCVIFLHYHSRCSVSSLSFSSFITDIFVAIEPLNRAAQPLSSDSPLVCWMNLAHVWFCVLIDHLPSKALRVYFFKCAFAQLQHQYANYYFPHYNCCFSHHEYSLLTCFVIKCQDYSSTYLNVYSSGGEFSHNTSRTAFQSRLAGYLMSLVIGLLWSPCIPALRLLICRNRERYSLYPSLPFLTQPLHPSAFYKQNIRANAAPSLQYKRPTVLVVKTLTTFPLHKIKHLTFFYFSLTLCFPTELLLHSYSHTSCYTHTVLCFIFLLYIIEMCILARNL